MNTEDMHCFAVWHLKLSFHNIPRWLAIVGIVAIFAKHLNCLRLSLKRQTRDDANIDTPIVLIVGGVQLNDRGIVQTGQCFVDQIIKHLFVFCFR